MIQILLASIAPGLFWIWYFYRRDKFEKEPLSKLFKSAAFGAIAVIPAIAVEYPFRSILQEPSSLFSIFFVAFFVVGLGEELCKFLAVYLAVYRSSEFNEPVDGVIYSITAAIGFSIVENVMYISAFGLAIAPLRASIASLAHASFTGLLGYFLGRAKFSEQPGLEIAKGIAAAAFFHGLYDFILMSQLASPLFVVVLVGVLHYVILKLIDHSLTLSPFE